MFSRVRSLEPLPPPDALTARMVSIGMNFAAVTVDDADIEGTLLHASIAGIDGHDFRVLAVLTTWLGVHHPRVNADRLVRLVDGHPSARGRAYWSAIARWLAKDRRFGRLIGAAGDAPIELLPSGTLFQVARHGEDERFMGSKLLVPKGTLRDRLEDVLTPEALCRHHAGYRNRVLMGPTFRADAWTALERDPDLSVADVARSASCSFAAAWQATQDFRLLRAATGLSASDTR